jgi:hypothetical protein
MRRTLEANTAEARRVLDEAMRVNEEARRSEEVMRRTLICIQYELSGALAVIVSRL